MVFQSYLARAIGADFMPFIFLSHYPKTHWLVIVLLLRPYAHASAVESTVLQNMAVKIGLV